MVIALEQSLIARQLVPLTVTCALLHMAIISSYSMYYTIWSVALPDITFPVCLPFDFLSGLDPYLLVATPSSRLPGPTTHNLICMPTAPPSIIVIHPEHTNTFYSHNLIFGHLSTPMLSCCSSFAFKLRSPNLLSRNCYVRIHIRIAVLGLPI